VPYDPQKHHRRSIRLKGYDYASPGAYFVTICTQGHVCLFGDVVDDGMVLNAAGRMVQAVWECIPERFPNVQSDAYAIMPNHFHAIIVLNDIPRSPAPRSPCGDDPCGCPDADLAPIPKPSRRGNPCGCPDAGTTPRAGTRPAPTNPEAARRPTLGDVVGVFKSITTHEYIMGVRERGWSPFDGRLWQRNYWEHIIRNDTSYRRIYDYTEHNPALWEEDQLHPDAPPNPFNRG